MSAPQKLVAAGLVAAAFACVPASASAGPIVLAENFSSSSVGFSSGYTYVAQQGDLALWPEGTYTVGTNPRLYHALWSSFGDHTTGDGSMLIVNGSTVSGITVWSTTVDVTPDTYYTLSAWLTSVYPQSPASLAFSFNINGTPLAAPFDLSSTPGQWQEYTASWYSGTQTTAVLAITDLNMIAVGNDFAVDDITFEDPPQPVPEPASSVFLLGLGLAGVAGLKKRWTL